LSFRLFSGNCECRHCGFRLIQHQLNRLWFWFGLWLRFFGVRLIRIWRLQFDRLGIKWVRRRWLGFIRFRLIRLRRIQFDGLGVNRVRRWWLWLIGLRFIRLRRLRLNWLRLRLFRFRRFRLLRIWFRRLGIFGVRVDQHAAGHSR
jgi:hypothetical protein